MSTAYRKVTICTLPLTPPFWEARSHMLSNDVAGCAFPGKTDRVPQG